MQCRNTHTDASCGGAVWWRTEKGEPSGCKSRRRTDLTPLCKTGAPPSPLFLSPLSPQGSEVVPPPYSHSHTDTRKTNYPVTLKFSFPALLFWPDCIHLFFCQARIWQFLSRLCSCGIWMTMATVPLIFVGEAQLMCHSKSCSTSRLNPEQSSHIKCYHFPHSERFYIIRMQP